MPDEHFTINNNREFHLSSQSLPEIDPHGSLMEQAYQVIKYHILTLTYAPGSYLTEASLAQQLSMSRMPVRMAVRRLQEEGWLIADFRRKIRVRPIRREDITDLFQLRKLLEYPALQQIFACGKTWEYSFLLEEKLLKIKQVRDDLYARERAETELHMAIVSVYHNQRIERIYQNVQDEMVRIGLSFVAQEVRRWDYLEQIISGLAQMVTAIREQKEQEALAILDRDHLSGAEELALAWFDRQAQME